VPALQSIRAIDTTLKRIQLHVQQLGPSDYYICYTKKLRGEYADCMIREIFPRKVATARAKTSKHVNSFLGVKEKKQNLRQDKKLKSCNRGRCARFKEMATAIQRKGTHQKGDFRQMQLLFYTPSGGAL
jgi:hypothetical protein